MSIRILFESVLLEYDRYTKTARPAEIRTLLSCFDGSNRVHVKWIASHPVPMTASQAKNLIGLEASMLDPYSEGVIVWGGVKIATRNCDLIRFEDWFIDLIS